MPETNSCSRCSNLNRSLQDARKEIVRLNDRLKAKDQTNRERKKLIDRGASSQVDAHEAADRAVSCLLDNLRINPLFKEYVREQAARLSREALASLDHYMRVENKRPARVKDEHSMPRHGRDSS